MSDQVTQRYPILQAHFPWHKARVTFLYPGMAFPICFKMITKKGHSNTQERIDLMERVCQHIETCEIRALVADREFIGRDSHY